MTSPSALAQEPVVFAGTATDPMRTSVRFPLRLPVRVQVGGRSVTVMSEDISSTGALFYMDELPPLESHVEWNLCLPAETMGAQTDVTVHCKGRVVRHSLDRDSKKMIGVLMDGYTFKEGRQ